MSASAAVWNGRFGALGIVSSDPRVTPKVAKSVSEPGGQVKPGARLEVERLQIAAKVGGEIGAGQSELDGRLEEAELVAAVVPPALELHAVHGPAGPQDPERVGQLDLAAGVGARTGQDLEDLGRQHVAADDRQIRWRVDGLGLLDQVEDLVHPALDGPRGDDAVLVDLLARDALDGEHRRVAAGAHVEQLAHARRRRTADDVVAQEDREGLVADERARAENGVAQAERLALAQVRDRGQLGDGLDLGQLVRLAAIVQEVLELEVRVEVILDRALAATGHDDDLRETRGHRLLDDVLDHRLVDEREHLFRLRFGRGKESGAEPGGRKYRLADFHGFIIRGDSGPP